MKTNIPRTWNYRYEFIAEKKEYDTHTWGRKYSSYAEMVKGEEAYYQKHPGMERRILSGSVEPIRWTYKYISPEGLMTQWTSKFAFESVPEMIESEMRFWKDGHIIAESARPFQTVITAKYKYYVFTKSRYSGGNSEYSRNGGMYTPSKNPNRKFGTWQVVVGNLSTWGYWIAGFQTLERAEGHARMTGGQVYTAPQIKENLTGMGLDQSFMPEGDGYDHDKGFTWPPTR